MHDLQPAAIPRIVAVNIRQSSVDSGHGDQNSAHPSNRVGHSRALDLCDRPPTGSPSGNGWAVAQGHPNRRAGCLSGRYAAAKKGPRLTRQVPGAVQRLVWAIRAREHACWRR